MRNYTMLYLHGEVQIERGVYLSRVVGYCSWEYQQFALQLKRNAWDSPACINIYSERAELIHKIVCRSCAAVCVWRPDKPTYVKTGSSPSLSLIIILSGNIVYCLNFYQKKTSAKIYFQLFQQLWLKDFETIIR